jgi:hypothetical protein
VARYRYEYEYDQCTYVLTCVWERLLTLEMIEWAVVLVARVTVNAPVSLSLDKYFNRRATSDNTVRYRCDRDHWFKYVSVSALHLLASVEYLVRIFKFVDDRRHSRDAETEYVFILPSCPIR